jgi:hypothetical protein
MYCAGTASAAEVRFFTVISVQAQGWKNVPQGLKALMIVAFDGTAKAVPFVKIFSQPVKPTRKGLAMNSA